MALKEYTTVSKNEYTTETVIEKSRFIACVKNVENVEDATAFVESKRKKFFDATHNCYAYIIGDKAKFSDDGEPQGTAGQPMYECLKNSNLNNVCVVVTRYFGGVKLGAGGLVRAYSGAVASAVSGVEKITMKDCTLANVTFDYSLLTVMRKSLSNLCIEQNVVYDDKVTLSLIMLSQSVDEVNSIVTNVSSGKTNLEVKERLLCRFEK